MAAPKGNKNAEKWTEKIVLAMLQKIEKEASKDDCYWLGTALVRCKLYRGIWFEWKEKFQKNQIVSDTIKRIDSIFEDRLFVYGLTGKVNSAVCIFGQKNNYGWTDRQEIEHSVTTKIIFEVVRSNGKKN